MGSTNFLSNILSIQTLRIRGEQSLDKQTPGTVCEWMIRSDDQQLRLVFIVILREPVLDCRRFEVYATAGWSLIKLHLSSK